MLFLLQIWILHEISPFLSFPLLTPMQTRPGEGMHSAQSFTEQGRCFMGGRKNSFRDKCLCYHPQTWRRKKDVRSGNSSVSEWISELAMMRSRDRSSAITTSTVCDDSAGGNGIFFPIQFIYFCSIRDLKTWEPICRELWSCIQKRSHFYLLSTILSFKYDFQVP